MRAIDYAAVALFAVAASCGGAATPTPSSSDVTVDVPQPSSAPNAGPRCGFTLYTSDYEPACQRELDEHCCGFEKECAADAGCAKLVACINACPAPKTGECLEACSGPNPPPGFEKLDAIASCSKHPGGTAKRCDWPVGGGH